MGCGFVFLCSAFIAAVITAFYLPHFQYHRLTTLLYHLLSLSPHTYCVIVFFFFFVVVHEWKWEYFFFMKVWRGRNVYSYRERKKKFGKVKLVKSWYADNMGRSSVMLYPVSVRLVYLAPSRCSVLLHVYTAIAGWQRGPHDSSLPQAFFFFFKFGAEHFLLCHKLWRGAPGEA